MPNPSSFVSRLVAAAFGLLIVAYLLVMAVDLIKQIWPWLIGIAAVLGGLWVLGMVLRIAWQRGRLDRW